jgi:hypothetical protein
MESRKDRSSLHYLHDPKAEIYFSSKIYISSTYISFSRIIKDILVQCNSAYRTNYDDDNILQAMFKLLSSEKYVLIINNILCVDFMFWRTL